jgi:tetratricopeptide (TPR) repeat protein
MKPFLIILAACSLLLGTAHAAEPSLSERYLKAQTAYDDERYAEAAMIYEKMVNEGIANSEVHFNLANANFKDGHLPQAVWHYRTAWYESPRDPDIKANLHFALNAAGAIDPAPSFVARLFETLSIGEWVAVAVAGYLLLAAALILCLLVPSTRRALLKLCLAPAALILVSAGGWWQWHQLEIHPEWVVVQTEATALYSPVDGTTAHYKLPLGALARQTGIDSKGWVEVEYDGKRGWLKTGFISRLSP